MNTLNTGIDILDRRLYECGYMKKYLFWYKYYELTYNYL